MKKIFISISFLLLSIINADTVNYTQTKYLFAMNKCIDVNSDKTVRYITDKVLSQNNLKVEDYTYFINVSNIIDKNINYDSTFIYFPTKNNCEAYKISINKF